MADRIEHFSITTPANTAKANAITTAMPIGLSEVVAIDVEVPPGPSSLMGWYLTLGGQQTIPRTSGAVFTSDAKVYSWDVSNYVNSGQWAIVSYNLDAFDHLITVTFQVNEVSYSPRSSLMAPLGI